jgi:hypothetical protein
MYEPSIEDIVIAEDGTLTVSYTQDFNTTGM